MNLINKSNQNNIISLCRALENLTGTKVLEV